MIKGMSGDNVAVTADVRVGFEKNPPQPEPAIIADRERKRIPATLRYSVIFHKIANRQTFS
jgi:hypothetical protein